MLERTLAIIKPEAISHESQIEVEIANAGLSIVAKKHVLLTKDQCEDFLIQEKNNPNFKSTCQSMCSDTCAVLILEGQNALRQWLEMLGPDDVDQARQMDPDLLRSRFGQSSSKNGLHGSKDLIAAIREIHLFFRESHKTPLLDDLIGEYLTENIEQLLAMGLSTLLESKAENPVVWLAQWLKDNNPNGKIYD